jgi:hypothetical protein
MADIKSESVADFIPESVADFARNTQISSRDSDHGGRAWPAAEAASVASAGPQNSESEIQVIPKIGGV